MTETALSVHRSATSILIKLPDHFVRSRFETGSSSRDIDLTRIGSLRWTPGAPATLEESAVTDLLGSNRISHGGRSGLMKGGHCVMKRKLGPSNSPGQGWGWLSCGVDVRDPMSLACAPGHEAYVVVDLSQKSQLGSQVVRIESSSTCFEGNVLIFANSRAKMISWEAYFESVSLFVLSLTPVCVRESGRCARAASPRPIWPKLYLEQPKSM
ncbi:hypothetical protein EVAR_45930_1 [Eumeta japonica]|uniref:Uncharacterized protein n=1 Tax=Eumeta variegata TaxID=151549 RepID=A0A4C1W6H5_EUMVA|nr:hypothetical protein EVAR_45930_1 [Eumeta japonica]